MEGPNVRLSSKPIVRNSLDYFHSAPAAAVLNWADHLCGVLAMRRTSAQENQRVSSFLRCLFPSCNPCGWIAGAQEIEIAYRLVPLVLALYRLGFTAGLREGVCLMDLVPKITPEMKGVLITGGLLTFTGQVTPLGGRVFARGSGPFGIIYSYYPYFDDLAARLCVQNVLAEVSRAENVLYSQEANRRMFAIANDSLDRFCRRYGFSYSVFIEHALGLGEATRQRFERSGEGGMQYFGADLEDVPLLGAKEQQKMGLLPSCMRFLPCDIGQPEALLEGIRVAGFSPSGAVMMVGNGFHEVRNQTNEKMIDIFRAYERAGVVLALTEESALSDAQIRGAGWNTYHAGFRYVHEISGQGLRPAYDSSEDERYSWRTCLARTGYVLLEEFTTETRPLYPCGDPGPENPPISTTYFCVPGSLAVRLGIRQNAKGVATP